MQKSDFHKALINWYLANQRLLPWRQSKDPYLIWVSEIILQQTRVNQGLDYYSRFVLRFPDIQTLANASEEEVLKLWEGLGYYSRARNMHETALHIVKHYGGKFPQNPEELEKLKGIGKYTAAAIASISFDKPLAVVDGNVIRFLSRYFGIEQPVDTLVVVKEITRLANDLVSETVPGTYNQAIMEFGALQCIPFNPDCLSCCFSITCNAFKWGKVDQLPIKTQKAKLSERFFNYLVVQHWHNGSECILLNRRSGNDIWKHLYDFPLIETGKLCTIEQLVQNEAFTTLFNDCSPEIEIYQGNYRHLLTHRIIHARFFKIFFREKCLADFQEKYICTDDLMKYPKPKLINNFINDHGLINPPVI